MAGSKKARKDNRGRLLRTGESYVAEKSIYKYRFTDFLGQRHTIYDKDLLSLRKKEEEVKRDTLDGLNIYARGKATLNESIERYLSLRSDLRPNTYSGYIYIYNYFVKNQIGKRKIADIKYSDILMFYKDMYDIKGYKLNTIDSIHSLLHPVFQMAVRDEIIRFNPTDRVMADLKRKIGRQTGVKRALTIEQQRAFLGYLEETNSRWKNLFTVMFGTGVRIGELIGLRWEDIDLEAGRIEINHSITYYPRRQDTYKCEFRASLPKTKAGIRTIPMLPEVKEAFIEEKEFQDMLGISCETEVDGLKGFIFCNRFNQIHNPQSVNRLIKRIREDYNAAEEVKAAKERREPIIIPPFSNHIARHTFCSRLCEQDINVKVIQAVMGHKDIQTTLDIYAEVTEGKKHEVFDTLANNVSVF